MIFTACFSFLVWGKSFSCHFIGCATDQTDNSSTCRHCQDTPTNQNAPWYIAGANQAAALSSSVHSVPGFSNCRHDILLALMNWVENGTAPNDIIATKWVNDTNSKYEVARQRPICKFPQQARFIGSGDPNLPQNWECSGLY